MGHEVEPSHQEDQVDQQHPVAFESHLALLYEGLANIPLAPACFNLGLIGFCLGEEESPDYEEDWRAGTEPKQGTPTVRRSVNEAASKGSREEIAKRVALLHDTTHQTPGLGGEVLQRRSRSIAVEPSHGNAEKCTARKELRVGVAEAGSLGFKTCHVSEADYFMQYIPMVAVVFSPASAGNAVVDKIQSQ